MAGLVAAARARELGAEPLVYEKGSRVGGSMLLSSGFAWRYRTLEVFREQCPGGDPALQRLIVERFDDALDWLESLGVELLWAHARDTALSFYTRAGFTVVGDGFVTPDTGLPHHLVTLSLDLEK